MAEGIDRAAPFTTAAPLDCLRSNGITFIGRYYSNSDWKKLDPQRSAAHFFARPLDRDGLSGCGE